jgi:hypothetical protein
VVLQRLGLRIERAFQHSDLGVACLWHPCVQLPGGEPLSRPRCPTNRTNHPSGEVNRYQYGHQHRGRESARRDENRSPVIVVGVGLFGRAQVELRCDINLPAFCAQKSATANPMTRVDRDLGEVREVPFDARALLVAPGPARSGSFDRIPPVRQARRQARATIRGGAGLRGCACLCRLG